MGMMTVEPLAGGYKNPVLALELVHRGKHIEEIYKAREGKVREFILKQLKKDIGFIILYVILFSSLSLLMISHSKWVALTGVACALLAGVLDFIENRGMKKAMTNLAAASDDLANSIRYPSLGKWALVFFVSILIGGLFLWGHKISFDSSVLGWILILSGLVGSVGVVQNLVRPQFYPAFTAALLLGAVSTLIIAPLFTFFPVHVVQHLHLK
jgi:hypothetical protein